LESVDCKNRKIFKIFQKEKVKNWCFIRRSKISESWVCAGGHAGGNAAPTAARALFARRRNSGGEDG
jgi:hypothetical protein